MAFNHEYENDFTWRTLLQVGLWDSSDFCTYINNQNNQPNISDFVTLVLQKNVLASLDEFESLLLKAVVEAKENEKAASYPLVDIVY